MNTRVTNIDFKPVHDEITATRIQMIQHGEPREVVVGAKDVVMVTIGSMVADSALGSTTSVPELITAKRDGSWALWETLARGRREFGDPSVFSTHIDQSKWESFTVTTKDPTFFTRWSSLVAAKPAKAG